MADQHTSREKSKVGATKWIALASLIVAVCAFGLAYCENRSRMEHDRLSVRPVVKFDAYNDEKKQATYVTADNRGLGPAIVRWSEVTVDNKPQPNWPAVIGALGLKPKPTINPGYLARGVVMPPSGAETSIAILVVRPAVAGKAFLDSRDRVTLKVCYCSMYNECWIAQSNDDDPKATSSCEPSPKMPFAAPDPLRRHFATSRGTVSK